MKARLAAMEAEASKLREGQVQPHPECITTCSSITLRLQKLLELRAKPGS